MTLPTQIIVLDDKTVIVAADRMPWPVVREMSERLAEQLPEYRWLVMPGPIEAIDLRDRPELALLAEELRTKIMEALKE